MRTLWKNQDKWPFSGVLVTQLLEHLTSITEITHSFISYLKHWKSFQFFLHSLQSTYHYCPVSFSNAGSSWQVGCGMAATLGFGGAVAKYMGVYKHPFRTDRIFLWFSIRFMEAVRYFVWIGTCLVDVNKVFWNIYYVIVNLCSFRCI